MHTIMLLEHIYRWAIAYLSFNILTKERGGMGARYFLEPGLCSFCGIETQITKILEIKNQLLPNTHLGHIRSSLLISLFSWTELRKSSWISAFKNAENYSGYQAEGERAARTNKTMVGAHARIREATLIGSKPQTLT